MNLELNGILQSLPGNYFIDLTFAVGNEIKVEAKEGF